MEKMTMRVYHEQVMALARQNELHTLANKAQEEIRKIDMAQEQKRNKRENSEKAKERREIGEKVVKVLQEVSEDMSIADIRKSLNDEYSTQKLTAVMRDLVENQLVERKFPEQRNKPAVYSSLV